MSKHFSQNHACIEGHVLVVVAVEGEEQDLRLCEYVLYGGIPHADLASEQAVEYGCNFLPGFEFEFTNLFDQ